MPVWIVLLTVGIVCGTFTSSALARNPDFHQEIAGDGGGVGGIPNAKYDARIGTVEARIAFSHKHNSLPNETEQPREISAYIGWLTMVYLFIKR
jgi:hypothetical protein